MFKPHFTITVSLTNSLMRIESLKQEISTLPLTPAVLASLRETARVVSTHYSTKIEGNRLSENEVREVLEYQGHFPGRERDEKEILGYYLALAMVEEYVQKNIEVSENTLKMVHALVMGAGKKRVKPTNYRDGQNVIREGGTRKIVYLPPEARDVPKLMHDLVSWLQKPETLLLPCPLQAAIAHYQYATIHPYYDGNGRTARLLTTWVLHSCGYGLRGIYSLEEYYARDLGAYYEALTVGPSHNYYFGRAEADISGWLEYFCAGMADSFERVRNQSLEAAKSTVANTSVPALGGLDARQRKVMAFFTKQPTITSKEIEQLFGISERTARYWCQEWVKKGFLVVVNISKKKRAYRIAS